MAHSPTIRTFMGSCAIYPGCAAHGAGQREQRRPCFCPRSVTVFLRCSETRPIIGYLAVHLLGLAMGTLVLPPSPSYFRRRRRELTYPHARHAHDSSSDDDDDEPAQDADANTKSDTQKRDRGHGQALQRRENDKTATELCSYAVVWWVLLGLALVAGVGGGVSRRMVRTAVDL